MHDDVTRPTGSMVVEVTLKSKMAAGCVRSEKHIKSTGSMIYLKAQINRPRRYSTAQPSEHMSALLPFKIPAPRKYDAILNSCVTTTTIMHVRATKALFYVIMHKVY